jgi:hypothetical protein
LRSALDDGRAAGTTSATDSELNAKKKKKKIHIPIVFSSSSFFQLFLFFFFQKNCISVSLNSGPASLLFALSIRQTCGRAHGTAVRCIPARK